jgi:hypothetical protein
MTAIKIKITSFISDDQPGFVECKFNDAWNNEYIVHEKVPVISELELDENSKYPLDGQIDCEVLKRWEDERGRAIITVSTRKPCAIETVEGLTEFDILPEQLIEINHERVTNSKRIEDIIGTAVTNIYTIIKMEVGGLDTAECFVELDNKIIIDIPFGLSEEIWIKELDKDAVSLFADLSDYPVYYVNKEKKSISEIVGKAQRQRRTILNRLRKFLFGLDVDIKEYKPYKIEYKENKLTYIKNRKIVDFLWYDDDSEKGYILLNNGYLISDTTVTNHGTGLAGLNLYESIDQLINSKGNYYFRLTDKLVSRKEN